MGHYINGQGYYVLKIGTTNNLNRRQKEHTRSYKNSFVYDWYLPLSKYNTLRYEDKNRKKWQEMEIGEFIRNDRFVCKEKPDFVTVTIKKTYTIPLK